MTGAEGEERPLLGANRGGDADAVHQRRVIATTFIMVILMDLAGFFLEAPQTKILEGIICSRHYTAATTNHDVRARLHRKARPVRARDRDSDAQHLQPPAGRHSRHPARHPRRPLRPPARPPDRVRPPLGAGGYAVERLAHVEGPVDTILHA